MGSQVHIREAVEADLPALLELYRQLGQDSGEVLPLPRAARLFARIRAYPDYHIYVAEADGQVVGTLALLIMDNLAHLGAPSGVLEDMVVHEARRGQGIGKALVRFALDLCRQKGCYKLALTSNQHRDAAHRFYESLGFAHHGYSYLVRL
jgi:GNAT superfamily N-acetyltransferase